MRTVITISLNGNAYQLDAVGFDALRAYLQVAEQRLAGNPDQEEILADLEQAIADKCNRYLGPHKNVVSASEVTEVLREMGPVDGGAGEAAAHGQASGAAGGRGAGGPTGGTGVGGGWSGVGAAGASGAYGASGASAGGGWSAGAGSTSGSAGVGIGGASSSAGAADGFGATASPDASSAGAGVGNDGFGGAASSGVGGFGSGAGIGGAGTGGMGSGAAGMGGASGGTPGGNAGAWTADSNGASAGAWTADSNGANAGSWTSTGTNNPGGASQPGGASGEGAASGAGATVRRLYQIREGAFISGVCKGLAAYLNVDVSIVRILFIVLTILTGGAWILVYIVMMFVIPYAQTSEQHAAAHGLPFTAEEVIARAKSYYAAFKTDEKWRRQQWREQRRMWRSQNKQWKEQRRAWESAGGEAGGAPPPPPPWSAPPPPNMSYSSQLMSGVVTPLVELIGALLLVAFLFALFSLATRHRLFGWALPGDVPVWVPILVVIFVYRALVSPLQRARYSAYYGTSFGAGWLALWGVLAWLAILSYLGWLAWHHWADVQYFFEQLTATLRSIININHEQPPHSQPAQAVLQLLPGAPSCLLHLPWGFGKLQAHG